MIDANYAKAVGRGRDSSANFISRLYAIEEEREIGIEARKRKRMSE